MKNPKSVGYNYVTKNYEPIRWDDDEHVKQFLPKTETDSALLLYVLYRASAYSSEQALLKVLLYYVGFIEEADAMKPDEQ